MPRRAKSAPKGKRYPLNMRTTLELREKVEAAARESGRSLVQEVEYRLGHSFDPVEPVFDRRHIELFRVIAGTIAFIEEREGKRWNDDASTMFLVLHAVQGAIASLSASLTKDWTPSERIAHALVAGQPLSGTQTGHEDSKPTETEDGGKL
jgi:hypothetical protein